MWQPTNWTCVLLFNRKKWDGNGWFPFISTRGKIEMVRCFSFHAIFHLKFMAYDTFFSYLRFTIQTINYQLPTLCTFLHSLNLKLMLTGVWTLDTDMNILMWLDFVSILFYSFQFSNSRNVFRLSFSAHLRHTLENLG